MSLVVRKLAHGQYAVCRGNGRAVRFVNPPHAIWKARALRIYLRWFR